jgi:hypothetical protein
VVEHQTDNLGVEGSIPSKTIFVSMKRHSTIRQLKYAPMTRALLNRKRKVESKKEGSYSKDSFETSRPVNGLSMSLEGRLRGVPRTRKLELIEKGVSANTLAKEHRYMQLPISTK